MNESKYPKEIKKNGIVVGYIQKFYDKTFGFSKTYEKEGVYIGNYKTRKEAINELYKYRKEEMYKLMKIFESGESDKFKKPTRVWINAPSEFCIYHNYHTKTGIAHTEKGITTIYFPQGNITSMVIDPIYLSTKNSQDNIFGMEK